MIDTSYLQQADDEQAAEPIGQEHLEHPQGTLEATEHTPAPTSSTEPPEFDDVADEHTDYDDDEGVDRDDVLREAIDQLDQAEVREAAALERENAARQEADEQRAWIESLEAELESERVARAKAEAEATATAERAAAKEQEFSAPKTSAGPSDRVERDLNEALARVAAARQTAEVQQALVTTLQTNMLTEQTEREAAITARNAAEERSAEVELELSNLCDTVSQLEASALQLADAQVRAETAQSDVDAQRERVAKLEADLGRELTARQDAETALSNAKRIATETEQELGELRNAAELFEQAEQQRIEAEARAETAEADAAAQRARIEELEADFAGLETARVAAEALTETAQHAASEAEQRLAELENATEQLADAEHRATEAIARAEAVEQGAADLRKLVASHEADNEKLRQSVADAEAQADASEQEAATINEELGTLREAASQLELAECHRTELQAREETVRKEADEQRERFAALEDELLEARTTLVDVKAQREWAAQRAAEAQKEITDLRDRLKKQGAGLATEMAAEHAAGATVAREKDTPPVPKPVARPEPVVSFVPVSKVPPMAARAREAAVQKPEPTPELDLDAAPIPVVANEPVASAEPAKVTSAPQSDETAAKQTANTTRAVAQLKVAEAVGATPAVATRPQRIVNKAETAVERVSPAVVQPAAADAVRSRIAKATTAKERAKENRRAKRVASRKLASLWNDSMSTALSCTMLDRSSTGAKLEVVEDRYNDRNNTISVGDRFTVTQSFAQERTSIACEVMWVAGRRCGVRFCGQIVTQINKPAKKAMPKKAPQKATTTKAIASLFGAGGR